MIDRNNAIATAMNPADYGEMGFAVFALAKGAKQPIRGSRGVKDATSDPHRLAGLLAHDGNLGMDCAGLIAIDVDGANNPFLDRLAGLEGVPQQRTPNGGRHLVFKKPDGMEVRPSQGKLADKVDVRTDDSYIVVAPSIVNDKPYEWLTPLVPRDDLPEPPGWLCQELAALSRPKPVEVGQSGGEPLRLPPNLVDRVIAYIDSTPGAVSGSGGHNTTLYLAQTLVNGFCLEPDVALQLLADHYNPKCEPPWSEKELRHKIDSAVSNPCDKPRGWKLNEPQQRSQGPEPDVSAVVKQCEQAAQGTDEIELPDYEPFPVDALPECCARFVTEASKAMNVDPAMLATPMLGMLSGTIGNTRTVRLKEAWIAPAVLWSATVAASGGAKSAAWHAVVAPLLAMQDERLAEYAEQAESHKRERLQYNRDLDLWKKGKSEDLPDEPERPIRVRYCFGKPTIQGAMEILQENPRGVLLARDELSAWLGSFNAHDRGNGDQADWLECYGAKTLSRDIKGQAGVESMTYVPRAAVSISGTIQPNTLSRIFQKGGREMLDNGMAARFLLAMPPERVRFWTEDDITASTRNEYASMVRLLIEHIGFGLSGQPITLGLTPGAKRVFIAHHDGLAMPQRVAGDNLKAAYSKLQETAARIALVLHVVRTVCAETISHDVDEESMQSGVRLAQWFAREAERLYRGLLRPDPENRKEAEANLQSDQLADVLEFVKKKGAVTARALARGKWRYRNKHEEAEADLKKLEAMGVLLSERTSQAVKYRPATTPISGV